MTTPFSGILWHRRYAAAPRRSSGESRAAAGRTTEAAGLTAPYGRNMPSPGQLLHRFRRLRLPPGAPGWAVAVPTAAPDPSAEVARLRGALDALADERA